MNESLGNEISRRSRSGGGMVGVSYKHRRCHLARTLGGMMWDIGKCAQPVQ